MAQAGFWAVSSGKISFRRDGRWYSDDEPINNARIAKLFSRCLAQVSDGRWQIAMADERAFVEVDDTPWVVTSVAGNAATGFTIRLNDDSEETLDASTLTVGAANVLYTRVKDGRYPARFLRPAYYQLAPAIAERDGRFVLESGGRRHDPAGRLMHVALVEPEIPPNTGSIARLCAATGTPLHLIGRLGFSIDDKHLKRAGLDYWPHVDLHLHPDWATFAAAVPGRRVAFSARATQPYTAIAFAPDDVLVFGCETRGLPAAIKDELSAELYAIPITSPHVRSLNLATAVAIVLYEGRRQLFL